jgi:hypothetical protein
VKIVEYRIYVFRILVFVFQPQKWLNFCVSELLHLFVCLTTEVCKGRKTFFQENIGNNWEAAIRYISQDFDTWKYDVIILQAKPPLFSPGFVKVNCRDTINTAEHVMLAIGNYFPTDKICIICPCSLPWRLPYAIKSCLY